MTWQVFADFDPLNPENSDGARVQALGDEVAVKPRAKSAEAEAKANEILSKSVSKDPNVLVSKCLDAVRESGLSPLGCWPRNHRDADGACGVTAY
jgi:hypothetical protein